MPTVNPNTAIQQASDHLGRPLHGVFPIGMTAEEFELKEGQTEFIFGPYDVGKVIRAVTDVAVGMASYPEDHNDVTVNSILCPNVPEYFHLPIGHVFRLTLKLAEANGSLSVVGDIPPVLEE